MEGERPCEPSGKLQVWGKEVSVMNVRPYQLMCCVCRRGRRRDDAYYFEDRLDAVTAAVRHDPALPLALRCNVKSVYAYQNPGHEYDTSEGELFNTRRDLDILHLLGLVPGDTRPAYEVFSRLFKYIPSCRGVCGYDEVTSDAWCGCRWADSGNYERGHETGVGALVPPRDPDEKASSKEASVRDVYAASELRIRPHHLMCMTCFHGGKETLAPIEEDNLFEAIDVVQKNPGIPITLIEGPCIICPPCSRYDAGSNLCVSRNGMGLRDEKKDLDVLQFLGMQYGDTMPAGELFRKLYDRVQSTRQVCAYTDGVVRGEEWTICGAPDGSPSYERGREAGLGVGRELKIED